MSLHTNCTCPYCVPDKPVGTHPFVETTTITSVLPCVNCERLRALLRVAVQRLYDCPACGARTGSLEFPLRHAPTCEIAAALEER